LRWAWPGLAATRRKRALGSNATALVNVITALADGSTKFVPDILVTSGSNGGGPLDGLAATAMRYLGGNGGKSLPGSTAAEAGTSAPASAPVKQSGQS